MGDTSHCTVILAALRILPACKIVILSCFLTAIFCNFLLMVFSAETGFIRVDNIQIIQKTWEALPHQGFLI